MSAEVEKLFLVFPQFPDTSGHGMIVGWDRPVDVPLNTSLAGTYWGDAAKQFYMMVLTRPDYFEMPKHTEFQSWEGSPQRFRTRVTTAEADHWIHSLLPKLVLDSQPADF